GRSRPDRLLIFSWCKKILYGKVLKKSSCPFSETPWTSLASFSTFSRSRWRGCRPGRINEQKRRRSVNLGGIRSLHEGQFVARKSSQEPSYVRVRRRAPGIARAKAACPSRTERSDGPWGLAPARAGARAGRLQFVQDRRGHRPAGRAHSLRRARARARHGAGPAPQGRAGLL